MSCQNYLDLYSGRDQRAPNSASPLQLTNKPARTQEFSEIKPTLPLDRLLS